MSIDVAPNAATACAPEVGSPELEQLLAEIAAGAFERERAGVAPFEAIAAIRRARLGALRLPRGTGGAGATMRQLFSVLIDLAEADPNVAHILRLHFYFVERLLTSPQPERDRRWLEQAAEGTIFGGALTELGTGNTGQFDPAAFKTVISPQNGGLVLDGVKYYSTGSLYADVLAVIGRTPEGHILTAVVPADREGIQLDDDWDGMGQALTGTGTSHFRNVTVHPFEIQDDADVAGKPSYGSAFLQLWLTAVIAGILRAAARDAAALVRSRDRTFTHAPSEHAVNDPILQEVVGELVAVAFAAESVVLSAADTIGEAADSTVGGVTDATLAERSSLDAAKAKVVVDELAGSVGWKLFDVGGASATKQSKNLDRHWRNARTVASHNPTSYKAMALGDHAINGSPLPQSWFF